MSASAAMWLGHTRWSPQICEPMRESFQCFAKKDVNLLSVPADLMDDCLSHFRYYRCLVHHPVIVIFVTLATVAVFTGIGFSLDYDFSYLSESFEDPVAVGETLQR